MSDIHDLVVEWRKAGVIKYVKWRTANDDLVCELCRSRAENEFLLEEIEKLLPGCENCRCWITPIVDLDLCNKRTEERWKGVDFKD
ncbi:MAG: hypothetical protein ACOCWM_02510 [Cyclobacteriaceae bacterium]